jgi:predicted transcriptional regulator
MCDDTEDEVREERAILAAVREAEAELDAGKGVSHEDVKRQAAEWRTK